MDENSVLENFTLPARPAAPIPQKKGIALGTLHWIERQSLRFEFRKIRDKHASQRDEWWVEQSGETCGPVTFNGALDLLLTGGVPMAIVHDSLTEEDPTPWESLPYSSWVAQRRIVQLWKPAFWLVAVILGWVAVRAVSPSILQIPAQIAYAGALGYLIWRLNRAPRLD